MDSGHITKLCFVLGRGSKDVSIEAPWSRSSLLKGLLSLLLWGSQQMSSAILLKAHGSCCLFFSYLSPLRSYIPMARLRWSTPNLQTSGTLAQGGTGSSLRCISPTLPGQVRSQWTSVGRKICSWGSHPPLSIRVFTWLNQACWELYLISKGA